MGKLLISYWSCLLCCMSLLGQPTFKVTLISEARNEGSQVLESLVKTEIEALLGNKYDLSFQVRNPPVELVQIEAAIEQAYQEPADAVIGLGLNVCNQLSKKTTFEIPTILSFILDTELQEIPLTDEGTCGQTNLTYIQSPFDIKRDLKSLYDIKPFKELGILEVSTLDEGEFDSFFGKALDFTDAKYHEITLNANENAASILAKIPESVDAVYALPLFNAIPDAEQTILFDQLAKRGIPVFSFLSDPALKLGAYAAYETDGNLQRIPRRVAINLMKIADGLPAAELPVEMDHFTENMVINMEAVKKTKHYPSWDLLAKAVMLNVNKIAEEDGQLLNLRSAVAEGLQNNLGLRIATKEVQIVERDVAIAKSNYLPQIDASATFLAVDENTVNTSFGTRGYYNTSATANLTQLILSEPAIANIAIQKLLLESEQAVLDQNQLDLIQDVVDSYLGILQSEALVQLRNENVNVTRKNYDIAQAKEQVGYSGTSDVYRWQSELALDNVDLNTSQAQLQQARFAMNALLNRSIKQPFKPADIDLRDSILLVMDSRMFPLINNPGDLEVFADFLVEEAFRNLPELAQLRAAKDAQERSLLSQNRAFFLPTLAFSAQYEYPIDNSGYPENIMPLEIKPTYNGAFSLQLPIFQGYSRKRQRDQTMIGIFQIDDQLANLKNNLELQVRSNLEVAGASFSNLELSREAATAAGKNFEIAQNNYEQGLLNITSLIDAQNAALSANINATNAAYTFMSDFMAVERAIGYYHFLAVPQEQDAFFQRFIQFITNR